MSLIAIMDLHPEHLNLPALVERKRFLQTGHVITSGKTDAKSGLSCEKKAIASSNEFLILK